MLSEDWRNKEFVCVIGEVVGQGREYVCGPYGRRCCSAEGEGSCEASGFQCHDSEKVVLSDDSYVCVR